MEARTVLAHCLGIFGHLFVEVFHASIVERVDGIHGAQPQATAAAHAFIDIDGSLAIGDARSAMSANLDAATAADAFLLANLGLALTKTFILLIC